MSLSVSPWWRSAAGITLVLGAALSVLAGWQTARHNEEALARAQAAAAEDIAGLLVERITLYEYGLRGARGAIVAMGEHVSREAFRRYHATRDIAREFPGAHGFGYIRSVASADRAAFEAAAAADGYPGFRVRQLVPHDGPLAVIQYIEPVDANRSAVGLDVASEPLRLAAAERAAQTGQASLTGPVTLVQATGKPRQGLLLLLPIYRPQQPVENEAQRRRALSGWSYAPLVIDEVLARFDFPRDHFDLSITDVGSGNSAPPFYTSPAVPAVAVAPQTTVVREVFGRTWALTLRPRPAFEQAQNHLSPRLVLMAGLLATLLLSWVASLRGQALRRDRQARAAQDHLATIVENSSDAIIVESLDGIVTDWNRAAEQIFGWTAAEAVGRSLPALIGTPESAQETRDVLLRAASGEVLHPFDALRRCKDGRQIDVSIAASAITDATGRVVGVGKSLRDISARRAMERQLQEFNARLEFEVAERTRQLEKAQRDLRTLLDALPSMVGYWDRGLVNRFANRAYHDWFGVDPDSLPGQTMQTLLGPVLFERNRPHVEAVLRGEPQQFERSIAAPDGRVRQSLAHYLPDLQGGQVQGFYVLVHDVTELSLSRRLLAEREALLDRTGRVARIGGWYLDLATQALTWTGQTRRIHEVPDHYQPTLETALAFYPQPGRAQLEATLREAAATHGSWDLEMPLVTATGREIWVRSLGEVEWVADPAPGQPARLVGAIQDVTDRRRAEQAMRRVEAAEAANAAKSVFLANISHEMRTPLNAVIGLSHALARSSLNHDQRHLLTRIQGAGRLLLGVINDVLDLSKIEAGQMTLELAPFDLPQLVDEVTELLRPAALDKQLTLRAYCDTDVPRRCVGDEVRLRQILTNLLANAVKFTERGQVSLRVSGHAPVQFLVEDSGIGMTPEAQERLFQPFTQADASTTRRFGGTGLGLSIVRHLVERMGGSIALDSQLGVGSRFTVDLPLMADVAAVQASMPHHPEPTGHRVPQLPDVMVLVVDDSDLNLEVARRLLEAEGARVRTARSGHQALTLLHSEGLGVDLVLMDVQMPGMDGLEVTRRLRADPRTLEVPIVALTAGALVSERQAALDAGMNAFASKPFVPRTLIDTLRREVERARGQPLRPPVSTSAPPTTSQDWPELPGIQTEAVFEMLGGDLASFKRLLSRLLDDVQVWVNACSAPTGDAVTVATLAACRAQAHKLQGSAGILGAMDLARDLRALELCWGMTPPADDRVAALLASVSQEVARLQGLCGRLADAPAIPPDNAARPSPALPLAPDQLATLQIMLADRDLGALASYRALRPALRAVLSPEQAESLARAMAALDFAAAQTLLSALRTGDPALP